MTTPTSHTSTRYLLTTHTNYRRRKVVNYLMLGLTGLMTLLALVPLFWIIGYVVYMGGQHINLEFFTELPKPLGMQGGGVLHAIQGTFLLTLIAGVFAIPPGLLAAFYVAYNPNTPLGVAVRFSTDVLAGIPSIVVGLFVYTILVPRSTAWFRVGYSTLAGSIALAILMLPSIIRTTEEMLKLVPHTLREAALGLGAPEWKTALGVILPAAGNGIITGFLLGLARASGETAPLLFTAFGDESFEITQIISSGIQNQENIFEIGWRILSNPIDSLPLTLYKYSQLGQERVAQSWSAALVLMLFVLAINILARSFVAMRSMKK